MKNILIIYWYGKFRIKEKTKIIKRIKGDGRKIKENRNCSIISRGLKYVKNSKHIKKDLFKEKRFNWINGIVSF